MQTIEQANAETNRLRLLKIERIKRLQMEQYRKDPLLWLEERFGEDRKSFVWSDYEGYENHEWDGDKNPLAQAWQDVANKKWVGVESATGTGKTYWLARLVFWFLDVYKDALVVTSAPKQDQLKLNLWAEIGKEFHKFKHLHPNAYMNFLNIRVDGLQERVADEKSLENSWQAVGFVAGTGADEESATKARGFHRKDMLIIIEESSGMNNAVVTAFKNTSTGGNNVIVAVGNPNSEIDPLHQFCTSGIANAYRISALDFPNVVLNKEIVAGAVTTGSIELRKKDYGEDSPLYAAMVRGISPAQSAHSLIKYAWIEQCIDFDVEPDGSYNAVGVDVANSLTGDKAALAWGKENTLLELQEFRCENASHLAYNIVMDDMRMDDLYESLVMQRVKSMGVQSADDLTTLPDSISRYGTSTIDDYGVEPEFIGVDSVGVGASTLQQFHNLGYYATALQGGQWEEALILDDNDKPIYTFASLRAMMYWIAREDLRQKKISLRISDYSILKRLVKELTVPRYEYRANTISVEPKESIKKRMSGFSPNLADAFVYWNFIRKGYRYNQIALPISAGNWSNG